jgi:hypothetical protein
VLPESLEHFKLAWSAGKWLNERRPSYPMNVTWKDHIESTPDVLRGKPRFKGTRIPVSLILEHFK